MWDHVIDVQFKLTVCDSLLLFICFTENLALHKQAWQSSTFRFDTVADRAVDGQYIHRYACSGQCAASALGQSKAEWRVDLGGVKNNHHVFLQYATDNDVWGIVYFNLIHSI